VDLAVAVADDQEAEGIVNRLQVGQARKLAEPVQPSLSPGEVLLGKVFQRLAGDEMLQAPPGGDVAHDEDSPIVPTQWQVAQEAVDSHPVARPCSLSTVVEWDSKTTSMATGQPYGPRRLGRSAFATPGARRLTLTSRHAA
jgi:hypothetical protein